MADKKLQFRLSRDLLRHLERVADEFALPSRNAALNFCLNRDLRVHPSKGRTSEEVERLRMAK